MFQKTKPRYFAQGLLIHFLCHKKKKNENKHCYDPVSDHHTWKLLPDWGYLSQSQAQRRAPRRTCLHGQGRVKKLLKISKHVHGRWTWSHLAQFLKYWLSAYYVQTTFLDTTLCVCGVYVFGEAPGNSEYTFCLPEMYNLPIFRCFFINLSCRSPWYQIRDKR